MVRRPSFASALAWCLLALLAFGELRAQTITSLSATEVAAPDDLAILGNGFLDGAALPKGLALKVRLIPLDAGKPRKTKLQGATDTAIHVRLLGVPAGEYTVRVSRKGVPDFDAPQTLVVRAPELLGASNSIGFACGRASVDGRFLGLLPGRVRVGGKRAKVLVWQPIFQHGGEPVSDAHQVTFVVPRGLGAGPHDVEVRSRAGVDTLLGVLELASTELPCRLGGAPRMAARLDAPGLPKKLRSKPSLLVGWTPQSLDDELEAEGDGEGGAFVVASNDPLNDAPLSAQLVASTARVLAAVGAPEGDETTTTILGTSRKGKAVRVLAVVLTDWQPEPGALLQGDDALALEPVVVLIDFRIQGQELVLDAGWGGLVTDALLTAHSTSPELTLHVRFAADELELVEGDGAEFVALDEALILNAREVAL